MVQIIHCVENTSIPVPFKDWDVESGNIKDHRQRFKEVISEVFATFVVNKLVGFIMLVPLIWTVHNIKERHDILTWTIGTRPEEDISYLRAQVMLPAVMVFFVVGSLVEAATYWLFNYKVHPWKDMLHTVEKCSKDTQTDKDMAETSTQTDALSTQKDTITRGQICAQEEIHEEKKILGNLEVKVEETSTEEEIPANENIPREEEIPAEKKEVHEEVNAKEGAKEAEIPAQNISTQPDTHIFNSDSEFLPCNETSTYTQTEVMHADSFTQTDLHMHLKMRTQIDMERKKQIKNKQTPMSIAVSHKAKKQNKWIQMTRETRI